MIEKRETTFKIEESWQISLNFFGNDHDINQQLKVESDGI
jgi:hypothetical protein